MNAQCWMLLLCLGATIACKKNDDSTVTTNSLPTPIPAPAGYAFPHTFSQSYRQDEFKVWINGIDQSSQVSPADIFEDMSLLSMSFEVKLTDRTNVELIDPCGIYPTEKGRYFFAGNTLYIVNGNSSYPDTIALAKGDYSAITVTIGNYQVSSSPADGVRKTVQGMAFTAQTQKTVTDFGKQCHIHHPDTVAYFNSTIAMK